jgi:hypothetical protein
MLQFPFGDCAPSVCASCAVAGDGAFAARRGRQVSALARWRHARRFLAQPAASRSRVSVSRCFLVVCTSKFLCKREQPVVRFSHELVGSLRAWHRYQCLLARHASARMSGTLLSRATLRLAHAPAVSRSEGRCCTARRSAAQRSIEVRCRAARNYFDLLSAFYLYAKPQRAYTSNQAALHSWNRDPRAQFSFAAIIALGDASFLQLARRFESNTHSPIVDGRQARLHDKRGGTRRPGARIAWSITENDSRDQ